MGMFNSTPNGEYEKNQKRIEELKAQMKVQLINMNFNSYEQHEIIKIIEDAQKKIKEISESLIGTNINNNPKKETEKAMKEIDKIMKAIPKSIKEKLNDLIEIRKSRGAL